MLSVETARAADFPSHDYFAYGLSIRSQIAIPSLAPDRRTQADVFIRARPVSAARDQGKGDPHVEFAPGLKLMTWPASAAFAIRDKDTIDVALSDHQYSTLFHIPLLGAVFATLLHFRGALVLHASAIEIDGRAVAFVGAKGMGKSTTAAAFLRAGHALITDDVLAIELAPGRRAMAVPGFPEIKLNPDSMSAVALPGAQALERPHPAFPKTQQRVSNRFCSRRTPLSAIYVLDRGGALTEMRPHEQFSALLAHSFMARFAAQGGDREVASRMAQYAALAQTVPVRRLAAVDDLRRVDEIVSLVRADLRHQGPH